MAGANALPPGIVQHANGAVVSLNSAEFVLLLDSSRQLSGGIHVTCTMIEIIVVMGALRNDLRLSFFNAALMKDPDGVLEKQGPNTQHRDMIRFTQNNQVVKMKPVIASYLMEAIGYAEAGIRPQKQQDELELPDELLEALESDPEVAEAFHGLTPGRKKSYVINLNSAKKAETRISRIGKFREKILAGKGAIE